MSETVPDLSSPAPSGLIETQGRFLVALWSLYRHIDAWQMSEADDDAYAAVLARLDEARTLETEFIATVLR